MAGELPQWIAECPVRADDGAPPTTEGQLADGEVSEDDNWEIGSIITCFEFQVPVAEPGTAWVPFGCQGSYKLVAITGGSFKEALIQPLAGSESSLAAPTAAPSISTTTAAPSISTTTAAPSISTTAASSRASSRSPINKASPIKAAAPDAPMSKEEEGGVKRSAAPTTGSSKKS